MSLHSLVNAMQDFLNAVEAEEHWHFGEGEREELRRELNLAKVRLRQELDANQPLPIAQAEAAAPAAPFKRILLAVDGGQTSAAAVQMAASLAVDPSVHVAILNVIDTTHGFSPEFDFADQAEIADLRPKSDELLSQTAMLMPQGAAIERLVRTGDPAAAIVAAATEWGADLIVMGTHSRGPVARFILGSTAQGVVRNAKCPVLTVRTPARATHRRPAAAVAEQSRDAGLQI